VKSVASGLLAAFLLCSCGSGTASTPSPTPPAPGLLGDTWTWNGSAWRLAEAAGPPARVGAALAFDPLRGELLLYGGSGKDGLLNDTWAWDGTRWTERHPDHHPLERENAAAVFDPVLGRVILFGGLARDQAEGTESNETWSWTGSDWVLLQPRTSPSRRTGSSLVYDAAENAVLLFGGHVGNLFYYDDTWKWDGATWTLVKPNRRPPGRGNAAIAFDEKTGEVVVFGGGAQAEGGPGQIGTPLDDTWTWNRSGWAIDPVAFRPGARLGAAMSPDVAGDRLLMFGGVTCPTLDPNLYAWTGGAWSVVTTSAGPPARSGMAMAFDSTRKQVVLFGGSSERSCFSGS